MQLKTSWSRWLFFGILEISLLALPAWSQQPESPAPPPAGADAKSWVQYGVTNGAKGDLNAAIGAFNQALKIDAKFAPAYFFRGNAESLQNQPDKAIADCSLAIQYDPKYKEAYYLRGSLLGQGGNFDQAIVDFNELLKIDPKFAPAHFQLGHIKYFKGDLAGAEDELNRAVGLDAKFSVAYFIRGLVRHDQGRREEAAADFQTSTGLNSAQAALWVWITEMEKGQPFLARKDLLATLNLPETFHPDDWFSQIADFLLEKITQTQLMTKARTNDADETNGHICQAWFYCGMHSLLSGNSKEAQDCFTAAVATGAKSFDEFVEATRQLAALQKQ
jgi:lipoprotein NlpI